MKKMILLTAALLLCSCGEKTVQTLPPEETTAVTSAAFLPDDEYSEGKTAASQVDAAVTEHFTSQAPQTEGYTEYFTSVAQPADTGSLTITDTVTTAHEPDPDMSLVTGYYFLCDNGVDMFIADSPFMTGPVILYDYDMAEFDSGDLIRIECYAFEESYPMGCHPEWAELIEKAGSHPLPRSVTDTLAEITQYGYYNELYTPMYGDRSADATYRMAALEFTPISCDGLPEYTLYTADGQVYFINLTDGWAWKDGLPDSEAQLPADLVQLIEENRDGLDMQPSQWNS